MTERVMEFINYLHVHKNTTSNTEVSYERDLRKLNIFLEKMGVTDVVGATDETLSAYIKELEMSGRKASTISRSIASIKAYFHFLKEQGYIADEIGQHLKAPKIEKKEQTVLTQEETTRLLNQPNGQTPKELRDKAMLELMYATGMRVSELISIRIPDVDMSHGCLTCVDAHKERIIPFGDVSKRAIEVYMEKGRPMLVDDDQVDYLFTNCSGKEMSRQGFWKIVKYYGTKAGIESELTPHIIRHSFVAHGAETQAI